MKCPFHGFQFDASGAVTWRPRETAKAPSRICLDRYRVEERYGTIFLWNGVDPPDHEIPDVLGTLIEARPELGPDDFTAYHHAFYLPFPAKWYAENAVDACHFAFVHRYAEWGESPIVEETPTMIHYRPTLHNIRPYVSWANFRDLARRGELTQFMANESNVEIRTYGGGIHVFQLLERVEGAHGGTVGKLLDLIDSARGIVCWVPVTEHSHVFRFTLLLPKVKNPLLRKPLESLLGLLVTRRDWGGVMQDAAIMLHRQEAADPGYVKVDRGLVRFRRFWDSRLLDRSLWEGDLVHRNGLRAGIRWKDAPSSAAKTAVGNGTTEVANGASAAPDGGAADAPEPAPSAPKASR